ncbi:MAG: NAD(P)-dependent alcohol dehydrogenase [Henriciella sp.]|nr:NAD(P)-dependent alcohol dehydrogenase [Henriciella sp.]
MLALHTTRKQISLMSDLPEPERGRGEVKVRVHYASLNPTDAEIVEGKLDLFFRLNRVRSEVLTGLEFSGIVMEGGGRFSAGDRVFGYTHLFKGPKTHQDVVSIPETYIAHVPDGMSLAEAAAFPLGAQTSLVALRDLAELQHGQSVLINGASGGLGLLAIQIARSLGARVNAIAGPAGQDVMTEMGAESVFDYHQTSLSEMDGSFDVVLELSGRARFEDFRHLMTPDGIYIPAEPQKELVSFLGNPFRRQKLGYLLVDRGDTKLLSELAGQVERGELKTTPPRTFAFSDFSQAFASLKKPGRIGRIVLRLQ